MMRLPFHARRHRLSAIAITLLGVAANARADDFPTTRASSIEDSGVIKYQEGHDEAFRSYPIHCDRQTAFSLIYGTEHANRPPSGRVWVMDRNENRIYDYFLDRAPYNEFLFFPVLNRGDYIIQLRPDGHTPNGEPFHLTVKKLDATPSDEDKKHAQGAIDRGIDFLAKQKPSEYFGDNGQFAVNALAMMALASGPDAKKYQDLIEKQYIPVLAEQFVESKDPVWNGHTVTGNFNSNTVGYQHSIVTLAMAEIAQIFGTPKAKELAAKGAECLLAMQHTNKKAKIWGGPYDNTRFQYYGGWRYAPNSIDADISVSGWCAIALGATAAANINVPGTRDALHDAVVYFRHCQHGKSFGYTDPGEDISDLHRSVGALIARLYGDPDLVEDVEKEMDYGLPAGTQMDRGEGYLFYYYYYATRVNYLRGGFPWETWRVATIRQLVKLQKADGSWPAFADENNMDPRYTTAFATMILRMCLNEVPKYLKQEVKGF